MGVMSKVLRQCRRPTGWLGSMVARGMNISHSEMTNWGLEHISIGKDDTILDIGCGGGGTIRKLARIAAEGSVQGGVLMMMGGEYKGGKYDKRNQRWVELADMAYHSVDEFDRLFCAAGFAEVQVLEDYDRGWMCGIGRKPLLS